MNKPAAEDFAEIARRWREIQLENDPVQKKPEEQAPQISPSEQEDIYWGGGVFW